GGAGGGGGGGGRSAGGARVAVGARARGGGVVPAGAAIRVLVAGAVPGATPTDADRLLPVRVLPVWLRRIWVTHASSLVGDRGSRAQRSRRASTVLPSTCRPGTYRASHPSRPARAAAVGS